MDHELDSDSVTIVIIDDTTKQEIVLKPGERLLIGREEATAKLPRSSPEWDPSAAPVREYRTRSADVSEKHAEVRVTKDGRVIIKDLNSTNGTLARLPPHQDRELQPNSEFLLGRSLLVLMRTPFWESIDDHGRFESAEDFAAYIQARLKEYGAETKIISAHAAESRRQRGMCTRLPLPGYQAYILVSWRKDTFDLTLERWLQLRVLLFNSGSLCVPLGSHNRIPWNFTGASEPRRRVLKAAHRVAPTDGTVLLYGKTGVGKDVLAHDIHNHSARAAGRFLPFNCAAIPTTLAESVLFGTECGTFTGAKDSPGLFEQAHEGTLFLDEIGDLPLELQSKLLRVIEDQRVRRVGSKTERAVNVRLIAATNQNLPEMVAQKTFRADLWYRLEGVLLRIPELHSDDILALTPTLFEDVLRQTRQEPFVANESHQLAALAADCSWPGNARQLRNALLRYLVYRDPELGVEENWNTAIAANKEPTQEPLPDTHSEPAPGAREENEEIPKGAMAVIDHINRLVTLTIAREVLLKQRWGAWAELGRRLNLTGAGAQDKIRRLGIPAISNDQPPDPVPIDRAIEEARSLLEPYMGFLRKLLKL